MKKDANFNNLKTIKVKGTVKWAHVWQPAMYQGNPLGYEIDLYPDADKLPKIEEYLLQTFADAVEDMDAINMKVEPTLPIKEDKEGVQFIKAKAKHQYQNRTTGEMVKRVLPIFDKYGQPLAEGTLIGNGSELNVVLRVRPYRVTSKNFGIALDIQAIQVLNLVEYGAKSAIDYGFDVEEPTDITDVNSLEVEDF